MIMFNYQLRNFSGPNTQNNPNLGQQYMVSPYDNPITNANYINIGESYSHGQVDVCGLSHLRECAEPRRRWPVLFQLLGQNESPVP